ncbi:hypothetical protein KC363_g5393 [Hortaea werneckii]|nr:hypothetical protein KC361_g8048 [Hortaea werneckii]KAI7188461.1 hypothetical protein KC363_g5393 [Hortaea werneckii]KAI7508500.1 hypothetical protein KC347_g6008 [Hortaea werneckii]
MPKATNVLCKRAADPGDPFEQMSENVQKKRLAAVRTLEQAWSEKQDDWLPKLLWALEMRVDGDPDQLEGARDWHTGVLTNLSKVAELNPGDPASAHQYLREASQHFGISWDDGPTAADISVARLWVILKRARRLAVRARSAESSTTAVDLGQGRPFRTRGALGNLRCRGLKCSDVDNGEPPMLSDVEGEPREESQESIVPAATRANKRLRTNPQPEIQLEVQPEVQPEVQLEVQPAVLPAVQPEVQLEIQPEIQPEAQPEAQLGAQLEPPTNALDRSRLELEEAKRAAELAFARFDMLEKKDRVQRLELQLSS